MMKLKIFLGVIFLSSLSYSQTMYTQTYSQLETFFGIGVASYSGEIGSGISTIRPSIEAGGRFFMNDHVATNIKATCLSLSGNDASKDDNRGYSFNALVGETIGNFEIYIFSEGSKFQDYSSYSGTGGKMFNLFFSVGAGYMFFKNEAYYKNEAYQLTSETYKHSGYIIPLGGGIRITFNKSLAAMLTLSKRLTVTDYLDDCSINNEKKDIYITGMVNIIYKINRTK